MFTFLPQPTARGHVRVCISSCMGELKAMPTHPCLGQSALSLLAGSLWLDMACVPWFHCQFLGQLLPISNLANHSVSLSKENVAGSSPSPTLQAPPSEGGWMFKCRPKQKILNLVGKCQCLFCYSVKKR